MRAKFKSNSSIPALALAMAAIAVGSAASPAAASPVAPAAKADGEYRPSTWVEGGGLGASGETMSITSDAAEPPSGTGSQLPIGLGLLGLGLVALVATCATAASSRRGSRRRLDPYPHRRAASGRPPAETGATS